MNNAACIGYALIACKQLGMNRDELQEVEAIMRSILDENTEEEAEEEYRRI